MIKDNKIQFESKYQRIAVEIAKRIAEGKYPVGTRLNARSTLAGNFNVSPETARKAINILEDLNIMEARQGSGSYVASTRNAVLFLNQYNSVQSLRDTRQELLRSIEAQKKELGHFSSLLNQLLQQSHRANNINALVPLELTVPKESKNLGKSIGELNLWHLTGATIVAIRRKEELIVSPGPYEVFQSEDQLYFVGDEPAKRRMINLLFDVDEESAKIKNKEKTAQASVK